MSKSARTCPNCGVSKPVKDGFINRIILALIFGWLVWFYMIDPIVQGYKDRKDHIEEFRLKNEAQAIKESPLSNTAEQH
jgi:F0F1-type ATP synthase membrane subunit b/b'